MMHQDRDRAGSFGDAADQYDRARPGYPAALLDELAAPGVRRVLDVGCGTGIAARLFRARGCLVHGVEQDARMAAVARDHGLSVDVARFEDWAWQREPFDLLIAAQSWHWIDPVRGFARAAAVLRPGGRFAAFWNQYFLPSDLVAAIRPVYQRIAPEVWDESVALGTTPERRIDDARVADFAALAACGWFDPPEERVYDWTDTRSRGRWLEDLATHSGHRTLAPDRRSALFAALAQALDPLGERLTLNYRTAMFTAARRGEPGWT